MPRDNYNPGKVIFMDTENTFRPDRVAQIAGRFNLDAQAVLKNVIITRCYTSEQQMEALGMIDSLSMKICNENNGFLSVNH
jgi:meiotic recombination protein DMC1